jgi:hypothetical protein
MLFFSCTALPSMAPNTAVSPPDEEDAKALDLVIRVLGNARSRDLLAELWNFEKIADVNTLRPLYQC